MAETLQARCGIVGGGPAGMMLGFLLARAGVDVVVLEKHGDFLRDFRGDTIHPSTLEILHELGLLDEFLKRPHQEAREIRALVGDEEVTVADFSHLPTRCKFVGFMPQWDFLDFIAEHALRLPTFRLRMNAEVTGLIEHDDHVVGLTAETPDGPLELRAGLIVGADGRRSTVRDRAGLAVEDLGAPIDVLWMRISRREADPVQFFGRFDMGRVLVLLNRDDYWQCAFVIPKGGSDELRHRGLESLRREIADLVPFLGERVEELGSWDDIKLLSVTVDRLRRWWRPGLLCIGDAAHAMSPIGGVGINLAIQDAVAAANILAGPLRDDTVEIDDLRRVERRRLFPTRVTQAMQLFIQDRVIGRVLASRERLVLPWPLKLIRMWPILSRIPARIIGLGVRPEHVQSPKA